MVVGESIVVIGLQLAAAEFSFHLTFQCCYTSMGARMILGAVQA